MTINVDPAEIARFSELAHRWWDPASDFKPLHDINPLRPGLASIFRVGVRRASPILALWLAPLLLSPQAFNAQPLFLMLLTGAATLGLEVSLRRADAGAWFTRVSARLGSRALPRL
ncbi:MAG TPA: hypothetical protein VEW70_05930, partial [Burkholderiales bacterium]|nr:hypothetical protein [Burkholderiales bacterium]